MITNFNAGTTVTFPLFIYGAARQGVPAEVNVLATALLLVALVLMFGNLAWQHRKAREEMRRPDDLLPVSAVEGVTP